MILIKQSVSVSIWPYAPNRSCIILRFRNFLWVLFRLLDWCIITIFFNRLINSFILFILLDIRSMIMTIFTTVIFCHPLSELFKRISFGCPRTSSMIMTISELFKRTSSGCPRTSSMVMSSRLASFQPWLELFITHSRIRQLSEFWPSNRSMVMTIFTAVIFCHPLSELFKRISFGCLRTRAISQAN